MLRLSPSFDSGGKERSKTFTETQASPAAQDWRGTSRAAASEFLNEQGKPGCEEKPSSHSASISLVTGTLTLPDTSPRSSCKGTPGGTAPRRAKPHPLPPGRVLLSLAVCLDLLKVTRAGGCICPPDLSHTAGQAGQLPQHRGELTQGSVPGKGRAACTWTEPPAAKGSGQGVMQ